MSKPRLADRRENAWKSGALITPATPLNDVNGAGGLVLAGGDGLFLLRPGAVAWKRRDVPDGLGPALAVAAEPRAPWRYAIATPKAILVFGLPGDQMLTLPHPPDALVTHLAWARFRDDMVLYGLWEDGDVGRLRMDEQRIEFLQTEAMDALGADVEGALCMVAVRCDPAAAHALWTRDGVRIEERPAIALPRVSDMAAAEAPRTGARVRVAVADAAMAYSADGCGTYVSRGIDDDFAPCEGLAAGGAVAFQGQAADSALFGAGVHAGLSAIDRDDGRGGAQRLCEIESSDGSPMRIAALQWDATRHVLWGASPLAGLIVSEEPGGAAVGARMLS